LSKIEIHDPEPALADLAALVRGRAEHIAALSYDLPGGRAEAADELVEEARRLAASLGAS
jgi:hypothetical protein